MTKNSKMALRRGKREYYYLRLDFNEIRNGSYLSDTSNGFTSFYKYIYIYIYVEIIICFEILFCRKATKRWTHQVRVNPATGLEGTLDDGFSWRKYGQKDILGAKHPRYI